ncbi:HPF/RaiA family ribosome-associated protein [Candidatus Photodesmus anomalopis]|uniref:HPF/RaiA family ribosome-associated protein n=1 Tax=Candidatus Photodesmus anomalopis TaxID=28176 RepID=UPI00042A061D
MKKNSRSYTTISIIDCIHAEATNENMYASIDLLVDIDKLIKQLNKSKLNN